MLVMNAFDSTAAKHRLVSDHIVDRSQVPEIVTEYAGLRVHPPAARTIGAHIRSVASDGSLPKLAGASP